MLICQYVQDLKMQVYDGCIDIDKISRWMENVRF